MSIISDISKQKNGKGYNLYVDGEYVFSINKELIIIHNIKKGKEIDINYLKKIKKDADFKKAYNITLNYLTYKNRTKKEIEDYLTKKMFGQEIKEKVINKLINQKFINDKEYTKNYILSKLELKPISRKKIEYDLINRGIEKNILEEILYKFYDEEKERKQLIILVNKLNDKYNNYCYKEKINKIGNACARQGFQWQIINSVIKEIVDYDEIKEVMFIEKNREEIINLANKYKSKFQKKGYEKSKIKYKTAKALYRKGFNGELIKEILNFDFND